MGLNTSYNCFDGAYSSFNRFRELIAKKIGVELRSFEGFGGDVSFDTLDHPIKPLLDHSDCDGILTVEEAKSIVKGIDMILETMTEISGKLMGDENEWLKYKLGIFKVGALEAINNNDEIDFH